MCSEIFPMLFGKGTTVHIPGWPIITNITFFLEIPYCSWLIQKQCLALSISAIKFIHNTLSYVYSSIWT